MTSLGEERRDDNSCAELNNDLLMELRSRVDRKVRMVVSCEMIVGGMLLLLSFS